MTLIRLLLLLGLITAFGDDGIGIDPHGGRRTSPSNGVCIDPDGHCGTAQSDEGNGFDPHGSPRTTRSDTGSTMDPNG